MTRNELSALCRRFYAATITAEEKLRLADALHTMPAEELPFDEAERRVLLLMLPGEEKSLPKGFLEKLVPQEEAVRTPPRRLSLRWVAGVAVAATLAGIAFWIDVPSKPAAETSSSLAVAETATRPARGNDGNALNAPNTQTIPPPPRLSPPSPPPFSDAAVQAAEAEVERLVAKAEAEAEMRIEEGGREVLIEATEARTDTYLADVEAALALDIAATENQIRAAAYNGQLLAKD